MKSSSTILAVSLLAFTLTLTFGANARETVLPAGTLLKCTLNEPNLSSATVAVGDPVLCHLHSVTEFGQQTFPRGAYLVGHMESSKEPGHFVGKGNMKLVFDRIGLPQGDMPLDAKVIATRGYKVDKDGDIRGKGHATRDKVEWMIPPLWPWKIITLPARGPRPTLKGESQLELRLMDDVIVPQVSASNGPDWHFFGRPENSSQMRNDSFYQQPYQAYQGASYRTGEGGVPQLAVRRVKVGSSPVVTSDDAISLPTQAASMRIVSAASDVTATTPQVSYASYRTQAAVAGAPAGVPVFALKSGVVLEVGSYGYQEGRISYELASGGGGVIGADEVDWSSTSRINNQRGVRTMLPSGKASSGF